MNTVRITSGAYKGQVVTTPGGKTHPMGERERIALFNMTLDYIPGSRVLDAYAGSGALGIEALSRGASQVEFLEKSPTAAKTIRANLKKIGIKARVVSGDASNFTSSEGFDVIIADPPYDSFDLEGVEYLSGFLKSGGVLVLSHPGEIPEILGLTLEKSRSYAGAKLSIYRRG